MNSKEFNVQVVKGFLAEAKKALAKLEYNDYEVADTADRIISGCIDELEELVSEFEIDIEQEEGFEDDELTVVQTMDELEAYLEDNGWTVEMDDEGWEIGQCSPAGEDFWFYIRHDNDVVKAVKEIQQYAYDFDIDEHVQLNLGARGAPDVTELVEDAHAIQEMLDELADGVNWCEKKTIREIVAEAEERATDGDVHGKEADFELE